MAAWAWILIAIAAVVIVAPMAMAACQRRTMALRQRFGPEYDGAVQAREGWRVAGAGLRDREKSVLSLISDRCLRTHGRVSLSSGETCKSVSLISHQTRFWPTPAAKAPADHRIRSAEGTEMPHERL